MQKVYFSHSYRDRSINSFFLDRFVRKDVSLLADQKSDTWCVAKLERYVRESSGFVSIIPKRYVDGAAQYSAYIGHELSLARRSRLPRLFFVERELLDRFRSDFPIDSVPFDEEHPEKYTALFDRHIQQFEDSLLPQPLASLLGEQDRRSATIAVASGKELRQVADGIASILASSGYNVKIFSGRKLNRTLEDVNLLEDLWGSDLCVFIAGPRLSYLDLFMGMAHAHCIPSIRLKYDPKSENSQPTVSGVISWSTVDQVVGAFSEQFSSFNSGMREPVLMAKSSSPEAAIIELSTGQWGWSEANLWDPTDGKGIVQHLSIGHGFVEDRVKRIQTELGSGLGATPSRTKSMSICRLLYDTVKDRDDFVYDLAPQTQSAERQPIRTAKDLDASNSATCLDLACLFASLLEQGQQRSVVAVFEGDGFAHALAGYWAPDEPQHPPLTTDIGTIRGALRRGDLVLFEATGVAQSETSVGAESDQDRKLGNGRVDFDLAKSAARTYVDLPQVHLRFLIDINSIRKS